MHFKIDLDKPKEFLVILSFFALAFFVRTYRSGDLNLYDDEILTALRIDHSFFETISLLKHSPFPPLYYAIQKLWTHAVGTSEWALRFPSAIFSSLTIIVIYRLGKELFNTRVGFISALLLVFSPPAIRYAQFAKMYGLFWFLAALLFLYFFRFLKDRKTSSYVFYILTATLCCYTMYTGFVLLVTQSIIFLLFGGRKRLGKWFVGQLIIISFCLPWVIAFLYSKHEVWDTSLLAPTVDYLAYFKGAFVWLIGNQHTTSEGWVQCLFNVYRWKLNCFVYVFLMVSFLVDVLAESFRDKKRAFLLQNHYCLLVWIVVSSIVYLVFAYFFIHINLSAKYVGFLQVPIILLVSSQLDKFKLANKMMLAMVMLIIGMNTTYASLNAQSWDPQRDWRKTAEELAQDFGKNDIIFSLCYIPIFKYYYKGDTSRFFQTSERCGSLESLINKVIVNQNVQNIYILYRIEKEYSVLGPEPKIDGFIRDYKVSNRGIGYLRFRRTKS